MPQASWISRSGSHGKPGRSKAQPRLSPSSAGSASATNSGRNSILWRGFSAARSAHGLPRSSGSGPTVQPPSPQMDCACQSARPRPHPPCGLPIRPPTPNFAATHGLGIELNEGNSLTLRHSWQCQVIEKHVRNAQVVPILCSRDSHFRTGSLWRHRTSSK